MFNQNNVSFCDNGSLLSGGVCQTSQSFCSLKPCPFTIDCKLAYIFECNTHISKSNQQPIDATESHSICFSFFDNPLHLDVCHNTDVKFCCYVMFNCDFNAIYCPNCFYIYIYNSLNSLLIYVFTQYVVCNIVLCFFLNNSFIFVTLCTFFKIKIIL